MIDSKNKKGKKRGSQKYQKSVYRSLALISQFGINMLVPIFLCTFLGIYLDRKLGTSLLVVIFFFVGALAGARNIYRMSQKIFEEAPKRDGEDGSGE